VIAAAHGPSTLWYVTRGAGAMVLVLLTFSTVLGIAEVRRWQPLGAPRFGVAALHRSVSLLALVLLGVHIATTLVDPFPRIGVLNAAVPFDTSYRPLWLGLGTLASDLMLAVVVNSLVRRRLGYRTWRGLHWLSYACWPVALLHGLGAGSDTKTTWMLVLTVACAAAVLVALIARVSTARLSGHGRAGAVVGMGMAAVALAAWVAQGPLASGWASRAGTPSSVLTAFAPPAVAKVPAVRSPTLARGFTARFSGPLHSGSSAGGRAVIDLALRLEGHPAGRLRIRLSGQADAGGGLRMDRSAVTLGPPSAPGEYQGRVSILNGADIESLVDNADGRALRIAVHLDSAGARATGSVRATPVRRVNG